MPRQIQGAYATIDAYLADVVDVLRAEVQELIRLGCTYIQIDVPQYAGLIDPNIREGYKQRGNDPDKLLDRCIELDNAVIGNHPGITFGIHLCRGNNQSKFYASGGYDPIAEVFERTKFNRFLLEYDDERSGGFEPLNHVPDDRVVVLGLVTTKKPRMESKDELKQRIQEASRVCAARTFGIEYPVRFCLNRSGEFDFRSRPRSEIATGRGNRPRSVGRIVRQISAMRFIAICPTDPAQCVK